MTRRILTLLLAWAAVLGPAGPVAARKDEDPLDPLYRRAAADLMRGRPLVVTVHVALCDNSIIWCGGGGLGKGTDLRRNLYWGGAAGLRAYFDRARGYRRIHLDDGDGQQVLQRVVYRLRVQRPSRRWRGLGISGPFEVLLVGLAYRGDGIRAATDGLIHQVLLAKGGTLHLADGRVIATGGQGHVVGYAGHNHLMDLDTYPFPPARRGAPLAFFALSCRSAFYLARPLSGPGRRAMLLSRSLMYPGAFTIDGLVRGLAAGEPQQQVYLRGVRLYARFQGRPERVIRAAFVHDGQVRFRLLGGR